jgi:hypothetical protein
MSYRPPNLRGARVLVAYIRAALADGSAADPSDRCGRVVAVAAVATGSATVADCNKFHIVLRPARKRDLGIALN